MGNIQGKPEGRTAQRRPAMAPSTLRARGMDATDVTVVDISQSGARIATAATLSIGEEISIGLSGVGARRAYVAWRRDGHYGCAFAQPLETPEVDRAFTSASVVRLGTPAQVSHAAQAGANADLQQLYGNHQLWRLPVDAVAVILVFAGLLGWAVWHLLR